MGSHAKPVLTKLTFLDGVRVPFHGMHCAQLCNDGNPAGGYPEANNVAWTALDVADGRTFFGLRTLRPIRAGEELYVSYGPGYWSEPGTGDCENAPRLSPP